MSEGNGGYQDNQGRWLREDGTEEESLDFLADKEEEGTAHEPTDIDLYADIPAFIPPAEFELLDPPLALQHGKLKNAVVAHKFVTGWMVGVFRKRTASGKHKHMFEVYYKQDKKTYYHELSLHEYGLQNTWVFLKKKKKVAV